MKKLSLVLLTTLALSPVYATTTDTTTDLSNGAQTQTDPNVPLDPPTTDDIMQSGSTDTTTNTAPSTDAMPSSGTTPDTVTPAPTPGAGTTPDVSTVPDTTTSPDTTQSPSTTDTGSVPTTKASDVDSNMTDTH